MKRLLFALAALALPVPVLAQEPSAPPPVPTPVAPPTPAAAPASEPNVNLAIPAAAPNPATDLGNLWHLDLSTGRRVTVQLRPDIAPKHVERIKTLTARGFYNGLAFHRVIDGFMAQGGDPQGTGAGGSDLPDLQSEFSLYPHLRGTVSMARADSPNSANSQFFIMFMPNSKLDKKYTAFGRVVAGMEHVDAIERGEPPAQPTRVVRATIGGQGVADATP